MLYGAAAYHATGLSHLPFLAAVETSVLSYLPLSSAGINTAELSEGSESASEFHSERS